MTIRELAVLRAVERERQIAHYWLEKLDDPATDPIELICRLVGRLAYIESIYIGELAGQSDQLPLEMDYPMR